VDADVQPVSWIANTLVRFWGDGAAWQLDSGSYPHEARTLKLDTSKAGTFLNWHPVLSLAETLAWIVEWYRGFQQGGDMRELTLAQIQRYEALIGMAI
jgi:CDP-glucose 4,6-dehydratase